MKVETGSRGEVGAIFSDGHVQKNDVTTANKHPDYDFFTGRT